MTTPVRPSVLDRLIDPSPSPDRHAALERVKDSVRRDLEHLLNTRRATPPPAHLTEVRRSLYQYGLPEIVSLGNTASEIRVRLREELRTTITNFEPRLVRVRVSLQEPVAGDTRIRFVVEGVLCTGPDSEEITFDAVVDPSSGELRVEGSADG